MSSAKELGYPYVPDGWSTWVCVPGRHRYHRTQEAALRCVGYRPTEYLTCVLGSDESLFDVVRLDTTLHRLKG